MVVLSIGGIVVLVALIIFGAGVRIVRPVEKGLVETLGKYTKTAEQGFTWIIPIIQRMIKVNITEQMVDVQPQSVIHKDKLNAIVDAVVYYKIKDVKAAIYNVDNHRQQLTSLARTTLRAVIGKMTLTEANEKRDDINDKVEKVLDKETDSYGVEVLRVELQKIEPPEDVQESMNEVVKAEQKKIAAEDFAKSVKIKASGEKEAEIQKAEGIARGRVLVAEAKAKAIKLVNESAEKYFKGNAQMLKQLEVTESSLKDNTKIVLAKDGINPQIIIGEIPITNKRAK